MNHNTCSYSIKTEGNGWLGDPDEAPFDAIHVGAAAESLPSALVEQLKPGGTLSEFL